MDLEISTDEIRRGIRAYLPAHAALGRPALSRRPFGPAVGHGLAEGLGATALLVPEEYGGLGLGLSAITGALFETGHELYPGPLRATAAATAALAAVPAASRLPVVAAALAALATEGAVATLAGP